MGKLWRPEEEERTFWKEAGLPAPDRQVRFDWESWETSRPHLPLPAARPSYGWIAAACAMAAALAVGAMLHFGSSAPTPSGVGSKGGTGAVLPVVGGSGIPRVMGSGSITPGLADVQMVSAGKGFATAVDATATLLATSDGGHTWHAVYRAPKSITDIDFVSASIGYLVEAACPANGNPCTNTTLVRTTDGGRTWSSVYGFGQQSATVDFLDAQNGWLLTAPAGGPGSNALFHTTNGGASWTAMSDPSSTPGFPQAISFISPSQGWLLAGGQPAAGIQEKTLYHTSNGGLTWTSVAAVSIGTHGALPPSGYVASNGGLAFMSGSTGFMALERGGLFVTHDGGQLWTQASQPAPGADNARVGFWSPVGGYLWEGYGAASVPLYVTTNQGQNWSEVYPPASPMVSGPIPGSSRWLGFGDLSGNPSTLIKESADEGSTWATVGTAPAGTQRVLALSSATLVGTSGTTVTVSRDGGQHWTTVNLPGVGVLNTLSFANSKKGWLVISGGLYVTQDGGRSWTLTRNASQLPFTPEVLIRTSVDTAYALGASAAKPHGSPSSGKPTQKSLPRTPPNQLWVTRDGGRTWTAYRIPTADFVSGLSAEGASVIIWSIHHYWVSADGGGHWREFSWPTGWLPGPVTAMGRGEFVATVGGSTGLGQSQYVSHDGGNIWAPLP